MTRGPVTHAGEKPSKEAGYPHAVAAQLVGVTHRQLEYWVRSELVIPSVRQVTGAGTRRLYSFSDIVQLKVIKRLLDAGMSLTKIRQAVRILQSTLASDHPLREVTLLSDGRTVYAAHSAEEVVDVFRRGQGVFGIAVGPVHEELDVQLQRLPPGSAEQSTVVQAEDDGDEGYLDRLTIRLRDRMLDVAAGWRAGGESLSALGDPESLADRFAASVPDRSQWDDRLGPFFRTARVAELLGGVSRQAVMERRQRGSILAMRTSDGVWVYPTWQFLDDGSLVPGASRVLQPFVRGGVDGWETAGWLESTFKELGGGSPRQHLLSGGDVDQLVEMAQDAASRLSA